MRNIVNASDFDKFLYHDAIKQFIKYQEFINEGKSQYNHFDSLMGDICLSLYNPNMEINKKEQIDKDYHMNYDIFQQLQSNNILNRQDIKDMCQFDLYYSMLVSKVVGEVLLEDMNKNQNKSENNPNNSKSNSDNEPSNNNQTSINKKTLDKNSLDKISMQIKKVENKMKREKQMSESYGITKSIKSYSVEDRLKLFENMFNSTKIKRISDIIGSLQTTSSNKKSQSENSISINDVTLGDSIPKILPLERMKLINSITKKDFYNKYLNKQLLQYDNGESSNKYKGSIIVCIDMSLSMLENDNELYAKALLVKLHDIAVKEHRSFVSIAFADDVLDVFQHTKSSFKVEEFIKFIQLNVSFGTDFESPLTEAIQYINKERYKDADIIFITDGGAEVSDEFKAKFNSIKLKKNFKVYSVNISQDETNNMYLKKFSDEIINVSSLLNLDQVLNNI
jgi:uncharacterized protein with von Willebrand factor type A (vWA) domain